MTGKHLTQRSDVASLVDAWIEIGWHEIYRAPNAVASLVDAWIEILESGKSEIE